MDSDKVISSVRQGLESISHDVTDLTFGETVSGGIVDEAALYKTTSKKYFVKWNSKPCVSH